MATIEKIKASKPKENLNNEVKKLNVCAYCRVSTDMDSQKDSFETQVEYYENYIKNNKNWNFVGIYSDYAISGTKAEGRTGFNEMLTDASVGKIDIIITKSISRFTRNLFDLLSYLNSFREYGVRIIFEEENIDTISKDFELGLKMRTMLAEEEVRNTSNHVKRAIEMKAENGIASGQIVCYGYDYHPADKSLTINEYEADIVRYIFDSYIDGYGADTIAKNLDKKGVKPKKTKTWGSSTIRGMLKNEKYIGDVIMGKSYTPDPINDKKRKKNNGLKDLIVIHDHHKPIISKEQFKQVQELLDKRSRPRRLSNSSTSENYRNQYAFSNKIKCYYCNSNFSRRSWHSSSEYKKIVWGCVTQNKKGKKYCPNSKNVEEKIIESAFIESYNALFSNRKGVLEELLETSKNELKKNDSKKKSDVIKKEIDKLKKDKSKLLELKLNNRIDDELFDDKLNQLNNDIKLKETEFDKYSVLAKNDADVMKTLEEFRKSINTSEPLQSFDRAVWDSVIDECIIGGLDADGNDDPYKITFIYKTGDKGSGNGLDYKSPRKNAKDKLCSLSTDSVSTKENQDTLNVFWV